MSAYDGQVVINTKLNTSGLESGIRNLGSITQGALGKIKGMLGTAAIAAVVTKGISEMIASASALDVAMAKSSTLFGDVEVQSSVLEGRMLSLSSTTGLVASEIGQSLYNALSAGVEVTEDMASSMSFMEKNAKLAKAGFTDIDTAVTATAKVLNAYKLGVDETDRIHKVLMQTQNKGITTVAELGGVLAQVTPTAAAFGVQFEEIGTQLAILTKNGTPAAQAVTQINQMIAELGKSGTIASENLMDASEAAGHGRKSFKELIDEGFSVGDILAMLQRHADDSKLSMVDMFSSIDAGKGALAIASAGIEDYNSLMGEMATDSDVVTDAYRKVMDTFEEQSGRLKTAIQNAGTIIGSKFLPALTPFISGLADGINRMSGLTTESSTLSGKLDDLVLATDTYKKAADEAKGSSDDVAKSFADQAAAAQTLAAVEMGKGWKAAQQELKDWNDVIVDNDKIVERNRNTVESLAEKYGITSTQLARMIALGEVNTEDSLAYKDAMDAISIASTKSAETTQKVTAATREQTEFINGLAKAIADGKVSIDAYTLGNIDLYDKVMAASDAITLQRKAQADAVSDVGDLTEATHDHIQALITEAQTMLMGGQSAYDKAYYTKQLELAQAALVVSTGQVAGAIEGEAKAGANATKILDAHAKAMAKADATFKVTGDDQKYLSDRISATENAMIDLLLDGVLPTDDAYKDLATTLGGLRAQVKDEEEAVYDVDKAYDDTLKKLEEVDKAHSVVGDAVDTHAEKQSILTAAIRDMISNGVDPASEKIQGLSTLLTSLPEPSHVMENYSKAMEEAGAVFKATGDEQQYVNDQIQATEAAMVGLLLGGVDPASVSYAALSNQLADLKGQLDQEEVAVYDVGKAYDDALGKLDGVDKAHQLLGDTVDVNAEKQTVLEQAIRSMIENGVDPANESLAALVAMYQELPKATEEVDKATLIMNDYEAEMLRAASAFTVTGNEQQYLSDRITATENAMILLLANGVDPTNEAYVKLFNSLVDLKAEIEEETDEVYDANAAYDAALVSLAAVDTAYTILGDDVDVSAEKQRILMQVIREMIANGIDPANEKLKELIETFKDLDQTVEEQDALQKWYENLKESSRDWSKFAASGAETAKVAFGNAFMALGQQIGSYSTQLESLETQLNDLNESLSDSQEDLTEAQEDYNDAVLSGDKDAIANAKKQLDQRKKIVDSYEEQIKVQQDEINSLKSGETAWKSMGKVALEAIASILEGLGAQLAGMAITLFPNFGLMALAAAGSIAAYVAAGTIRGYAGSYAEGGIVPQVSGVSPTGDKHVASVNPGELILNAAQQQNVAAQLAMLSRLTELIASINVSSHSIVVNMSGATINGLDEEKVGRAIYRNIKTLQHEGVLGEW